MTEVKTMPRNDKLKIDIEYPGETIAYFLDAIREGRLAEVTRCKDCKYAKWDERSRSHYCEFTETSVPRDGFCWRGKEREGDTKTE